MKWCSFCEREKPLEAFYPEHRNRDGRTAWCRVCRNYKSRTRRRKRYHTDRAYRRRINASNRDKYQRRRPIYLERQWARDEAKRLRARGVTAA